MTRGFHDRLGGALFVVMEARDCLCGMGPVHDQLVQRRESFCPKICESPLPASAQAEKRGADQLGDADGMALRGDAVKFLEDDVLPLLGARGRLFAPDRASGAL